MGTVLSQMGSDIQRSWTMLLCDPQIASCCGESHQPLQVLVAWTALHCPDWSLSPPLVDVLQGNRRTDCRLAGGAGTVQQNLGVIGKCNFHSLRVREQDSLLVLGDACCFILSGRAPSSVRGLLRIRIHQGVSFRKCVTVEQLRTYA